VCDGIHGSVPPVDPLRQPATIRKKFMLDSTCIHNSSFRVHIPFLALLVGFFYVNFFSRIIFSPLMPSLESDLGISHGGAGSLFFLISVGYFISLLSSGFVTSRIPHYKTIMFSGIALGILELLISLSTTLNAVRAGLFAVGLTTGIYIPSAITTITSALSQRHWGKGLSFHELSPNLALFTAPLIAELFLSHMSWRILLAVTGLLSLVLSAMIPGLITGGRFTSEKPDFRSFHRLATMPSFWIMIALFTLGVSSVLGVYSMLPLYLTSEHGIGRMQSNTWIGMSRMLTPVMVFVTGWAIDRFGPEKTLGVTLIFTGLLTLLLGIVSGKWILYAVFVQPLPAVCFFPAGMTVLAHIVSVRLRSLLISLTVPAAYLIGSGVVPAVLGRMGDAGHFAMGFILLGALILSGAGLTVFLNLSTGSGSPEVSTIQK